MVTTDGHLLGGKILYRQPAGGFRSGIEPVLLAASVPARSGEHVLEAGTGPGAALLCLAARINGVSATGIEANPALADLATGNAMANGFVGIEIIAARVEDARLSRRYDHAIANPPYHAADGSASPDAAKEAAKRGSDQMIRDWIGCLSRTLRNRGTLTLIVPASLVPLCLAGMTEVRCPCTSLFPLWPYACRPAKLVMLRGVKDSRSPMRLMAGAVLHQPHGGYTGLIQDVLRNAAALPITGEPAG